jgi:asparagine synthase (glutamine-hydrolysing)
MILAESRIAMESPAEAKPMPPVEALIEPRHGWQRLTSGGATIWFRGHAHGRSAAQIAAEAAALGEAAVAAWLDRLDGHYSLVVLAAERAWAAVDPVRSYPLIWARDGARVVVTHSGPAIEARLGLGAGDIDPAIATAVAHGSFTIGDATLYGRVRQIGPGQYLWIDGGGVAQRRYHRWQPWRPIEANPEELAEQLSALNRKLIDDLVTSAGGRPILVPLSAGLDSRFMVSGLKEAGYAKVRCVAYGLAGNREAEMSREIARRLGYPWTFVPYTQGRMRRTLRSADYAAYKAYSDSLTGIHFPQEYRMLADIIAHHALAPDTIAVNGQSGDFIAGNHIPASLFDSGGNVEARRQRVIAALMTKHFKHWSALATPARLATIASLLAKEIDAIGGMPESPAGDHGIYEYCEFQDRQSKYVLNGQRTYEYFGLEWRVPLWDRAYMDFWAQAPLAAKERESLYRSVLVRDNWGGVWRDVPVNPQRVRPHWIRPLRAAAKLAFAPLGRARWHRFERRAFQYWMSNTCAYAAWPWHRVAFDGRGHNGATSFHAAAYLEAKGVLLDGGRAGMRA